MRINTTQKRMISGGIILATAALLTFPLVRSMAQKSKKDTTVVTEDKDNNDSTRNKRKSVTVDRNNRTFRIENGDLEKSMKELERSMEQLEKLDLDQLGDTIETSLKSIDMGKIQESVELALKSVDLSKIQETVQAALKSVDMDKIKIEMDLAMKQVDLKNIQKEVAGAMKEAEKSMQEVKNINMDDMKKEMEKAKIELGKAKFEMKDEMEKAKVEIGKAKVKLGQMKEMFTEMKKDGLIKEGEKFNINWNDGKLYINEKEQPQTVTEKYKKYMDLDFHLNKLDKDDDDNDL